MFVFKSQAHVLRQKPERLEGVAEDRTNTDEQPVCHSRQNEPCLQSRVYRAGCARKLCETGH